MTVTAANAVMGPANLYMGLFGAAEPAETNNAIRNSPGVAWTDLGGTMGATTFTPKPTYKDLEYDQVVMPVGASLTGLDVTVKFKVGEVTLTNLQKAIQEGTLTVGSGYEKLTPDLVTGVGTQPTYRAFLLDGYGPSGLRRRLIVRKVLSTDGPGGIEFGKEVQQTFDVTLKGYWISAATAPYVLLQETSGS